MADYGIKVLSPVGPGKPSEVVFTTKYPLAKLDTQLGIDYTKNPVFGPVSFQDISLFFNSNPPFDPTGATEVFTEVYRFAHGYSGHIPTWWVLFQNRGASNDTAQWAYGNETAIIRQTFVTCFAQLYVQVDTENVIIFILKSFTPTHPEANIVGFTILLRFYVFVEPFLFS
jgi:hypothetical protein